MNEEQKEEIRGIAEHLDREKFKHTLREMHPEAFDKPEREGLNVRIEYNKKEGLPIHMSEISLAAIIQVRKIF